ncbi:MAG: hypothetical protein LBF27_17780 [Sphingobacterium sp.]|jgi:CRP-like cAMP-binding protein|nr:hypothetical protein [Sphingobacterium sp.]
MPPIRENNPAYQFLIRFWSKHCELEESHRAWIKKHIQVYSGVKTGHMLYYEGFLDKKIFFATKGLIGRVIENEETGRRQLINVALPGMALMSTAHFYSDTPSLGDIVVLRPDTDVVILSYHALLNYRQAERIVDTLIGMLVHKKKKQLACLLRISRTSSAFERCLRFTNELPELYHILYQREVADLLDISRTTVQSVSRYLAKQPGK